MNILLLIIIFLWSISSLRLLILIIAEWQLKEYRWDRMRENLKLKSTQKRLYSPSEVAKWLILLFLVSGRFSLGLTTLFFLFVLLFDIARIIYEIWGRVLIRPKGTGKAFAIFAISFFVTVLIFYGVYVSVAWNLLLTMIVLNRFIPVLVTLIVFIINIVSAIFKKNIIEKAKRRRRIFKDIVAIGVTGSYGKSSTKEILAGLLNKEGLVVTPGNTNTEIGVAKFILSEVEEKTKTIIAEMGAYRRKEIAKLTNIVQPQIGIITAIGNQHLGLFGSVENIASAKYELVEALPENGVAIFNNDNYLCQSLAEKTKHCKVLTYGITKKADLMATVTDAQESWVRVRIDGLTTSPDINLPIPKELLGNVLAAMLAAYATGESWDNILERVRNIKIGKQTLDAYQIANGFLVVDDSYNSNVEGVNAAIESLGRFKRKEIIVVITPMIELGQDSIKSHEKVGSTLARNATKVYYTNVDFYSEILSGARKVKKDFEIIIEANPKKIIKQLETIDKKNAVVLLEGRVPKLIREYLER